MAIGRYLHAKAVLLALAVISAAPKNEVQARYTSNHLPAGINEIRVGNLKLKEVPNGGIGFEVDTNGTISLSGNLGIALPDIIESSASACADAGGADECLQWGDYAKLSITAGTTANGNCARVEWVSTYARRLEDCFDLVNGQHWYGGIQVWYQTYPYEVQEKSEMANVPGVGYGGVTENYWLTTNGAAIHVDEDVPLFTSLNSVHKGQFCLVAKDEAPFVPRGEVRLNYDICSLLPSENILDLHTRALGKYYDKPQGTPDLNMLIRPFWSTWAQYHADVNEKVVLEFAQRIKDEGFLLNSHVEIDDKWETCYGDAEFDLNRFPDPAGLVQKLKDMGFGVTLWIHPFINFNCPSFQTAFERNYFIRDRKDKPAIASWWDGNTAGIIDFSNPEAVDWWKARLEKLRTLYGIDSFKFDAGEYDSLPASVKMAGENLDNLIPNAHTTEYVKAVAPYGGMIEVRVARRNQKEAIFTRMIDKDSRWGYDNGLKSLIPTLLHFSMLGYSYCLPDMIGGNAYGEFPSKELYIRWMQANILMPAVQISIVPWAFDQETIQLTQQVLQKREEFADYLRSEAGNSVVTGMPINRPMWFRDPEDSNLFAIDDQYMVGHNVLVAPVLTEGAVSRDVYFPSGDWVAMTGRENGTRYSGPGLVNNIAAPLDTVLVFVSSSELSNVIKA